MANKTPSKSLNPFGEDSCEVEPQTAIPPPQPVINNAPPSQQTTTTTVALPSIDNTKGVLGTVEMIHILFLSHRITLRTRPKIWSLHSSRQ